MSAPAAIAVAKLMIPESTTPETATERIQLPKNDTLNGLDAAARSKESPFGDQRARHVDRFYRLSRATNQIIGYLTVSHWS